MECGAEASVVKSQLGRGPVKERVSVDSGNPLVALEARLSANTSGMCEIAQRLENIVDRLLGQVPEKECADQAQHHYVSGQIGQCHDTLTQLEHQLTRIAVATGQIDCLGE